MTEAPDGFGPGRTWAVSYWVTVALAFVGGIAATVTQDTARRASLVVLLAMTLALVILVRVHRYRLEELPLTGPGYVDPREGRTRTLHKVATTLYVLGLLVIVVAALMRFRYVTLGFPAQVVAIVPALIALHLLLVASAVWGRRHVAQEKLLGGLARVHGWVVGLVAFLVVLLAVVMMSLPGEEQLGGLRFSESDLLVFALVATLAAGTQMFMCVGLTTPYDIGRGLVNFLRRRGEARNAPPVVYAGLVTLGFTVVVGLLLTQVDFSSAQQTFSEVAIVWVLALLPVAVGSFFLISWLMMLIEARRGLYNPVRDERRRAKLTAIAISTVLSLGFSYLLLQAMTGRLDAIGPLVGTGLREDLILLVVLSATAPIGLYFNRERRRITSIESRLPDFLNDLSETRRAGLTLAAGLQSAAKSDYGPLSEEVRKIEHQVSWGISFTEAFQRFAQRVPTPLVQRTTSLIVEAARTGGSVSEILRASAIDARQLRGLEDERRASMATFLIVIYVVFFVFLSVLAVLHSQFIPQVVAATAADFQTTGIEAPFTTEKMGFVYYTAAIVQSIGNGLVGGVLTTGRVTAGLRHVAVMSVASWVIFRLVFAGF